MSDLWKNLCILDGATAGWLLDEAFPSTTFSDYTGNGWNLSPSTNFASSAAAYQGSGLVPGDGDYSVITGLTANAWIQGSVPTFSTAGTIEFWTLFTGSSSTAALVSGASNDEFEVVLSGGTIRTNLTTGAGVKTADSGVDITTPGAVYVVATFDATNLKIYVNGVLKATTAAGAIVSGTTGLARLGLRAGGGALNGYLEKVAFYPIALSAVTITRHYAAGTTNFRLAPVTPWAGNTGIARRYRNCGSAGNSMRLLHIGDSITAAIGSGMQRCLKPGKWAGFLNGVQVSTPNGNFGVQMIPTNRSWGDWTTDAGGTLTFTNNGGTTHNANGPGGDGSLHANNLIEAPIDTPFAYSHELHGGDFIWEALFRGVQPVVRMLIKKTATGDDNQFFAGLNLHQFTPVVRVPTSGTLTCSGSGWATVDIPLPLDMPATTTFGNFNCIFSDDAVTTTTGKTLTVAPWCRVFTGELGFEYGNIAVGGTRLSEWSAANGIYSDDLLTAYCSACGVDTFMVMLGQNDGASAGYQTHLNSLVSRLRGLVPGCAIILVSTYETSQLWGSSEIARMDAISRSTAAADGAMLYLDLYRAFGAKQMNYANTGASGTGASYYDFFGITDGVHPSDQGRARVGELIDSLLQTAAYAGDPALLSMLAANISSSGVYAAREDVEDQFGRASVARWSQLDPARTDIDPARIRRALEYAAASIDSFFRGGPYAVPLKSVTSSPLVRRWAATLAGVWLQESAVSLTASAVPPVPAKLLEQTRSEMELYKSGALSLDADPAPSNGPTAPTITA